ncbi:PQQ-dependent sugar dehydrogenase [Elongatibacter sediminis]|uniref:PQQ-dependent sugar dehydrogenase n=1 Tax=Elongatibacter sediminis TaxID=3119006 RepID=A0AAW9RFQ7_9GAMM
MLPYRFLFILLVVLPFAANAVQVQFQPDRDASLYEDLEGDVANGSGSYLFFGKVGSAGNEELRRALMHFDVSSIPDGARIESVQLQVEVNQIPMTSGAGGLATLHRVLDSWGEGASDAFGNEGTGTTAQSDDATWQHRFYSDTDWVQDGGDFTPAPSASVGYAVAYETLTFASTSALVADVQSWVNDPVTNHGWILLGNESLAYSARRIYARESVGQAVPLLTVDYVIPSPTDNLSLTPVATGLDEPVGIVNAGDGSDRLFIVERSGFIRILDTTTGTKLSTPYLDLSTVVDASQPEQGLLGLAFHPDFASNRQFYVYYIRDPGPGADRSVVAMYQQSVGDPNVAATTPTVLMEFNQDSTNHNGGDLHFGADGYLYIASGDGGGGNDTYNNAQNVDTLKGKILRIDVDGSPSGELCGLSPAYGIPPGNAFPGASDGCDEILHMGLRNPWRFSFDAQTEELFIGDVGQGGWEEIDYAVAGASSQNFGWPCFEGTSEFRDDVVCPDPVAPIIEYQRLGFPNECSVVGGYVYRGPGAGLQGYYVFGDYCSARIWVAGRDGNTWSTEEWTAASGVLNSITAFGQDEHCALYVADSDAGIIYRIDDTEGFNRSGFEALRCQ